MNTISKHDIFNDRYRIIRKIGEGGMGVVWLAEDILLDLRKLVLKALPIKILDDQTAINRLKKEAQISLNLSHPNLAAVRGFEVHKKQPYIVMDFVEGQTLSHYLSKQGTLSDFETFELFAPLAAALDYAHTMGVIHRDIKPSNIMLTPNGNPVLLDFGISSETRNFVNNNGQISGTLPYMSPEQLSGAPPDTSQDVYSLAATAYECIIGNPPFYKGDIAKQILYSEPPQLNCKCWFCSQIQFGLSKNMTLRTKRAIQFADAERRRRAFIRWVLHKTEGLIETSISDNPMAISRLEYIAENCLKELGKYESSSIELPFIIPDKHIEFKVTRNDVRSLYW